MKKHLYKLFLPALAIIASGIVFSSCSDDKGAQYLDEFYTVSRNQWSWNEDYERWEVFFDNRNIDNWMYEYGVSNGYVWVTEDGPEARKQLEYNYLEVYNGVYYNITIGYDISRGSIGFYIYSPYDYEQDAVLPREAIPSPLDFKVTLFYQ